METKNESTAKTRVYNIIILDKSGSMNSIRKEAIDGCNETIGSIRAAQKRHHDTQEHYISLAAFCECGIDMIYDKTPIDEAETLTWEKYSPCCMTPLFDAIGNTVKRMETYTKSIEEFVETSVLVTIITDGYENASKEWNSLEVKKLIEACKEQGWMFSFIGASEDIVNVATHISITNTVLWEQTSKGTEKIFENENLARDRFYDKMAYSFCCESASPMERREMKKRFAKEYYDKEKK
jgi:hypothetical protein